MSEKSYYVQTDPQYKVRMPPELKEKIVKSAKEHNRSINADIVARLQESFDRPTISANAPVEVLENYFVAIKQEREYSKKILETAQELFTKLTAFHNSIEESKKNSEQ